MDGDGDVPSLCQPVSRQRWPARTCRTPVKPPVLPNPQFLVIDPLGSVIVRTGGGGGYLHGKVRRFPLVGYDVPVLSIVQVGVHVKSNIQVRVPNSPGVGRTVSDDVQLPSYDSGFRVSQVGSQTGHGAIGGKLGKGGHVFGLLLRRIFQLKAGGNGSALTLIGGHKRGLLALG